MRSAVLESKNNEVKESPRFSTKPVFKILLERAQLIMDVVALKMRADIRGNKNRKHKESFAKSTLSIGAACGAVSACIGRINNPF